MKHITIIFFIIVLSLFSGCKTLDVLTEVGTSAAVATGVMSSQQAEYTKSAAKVGSKVFNAMKDITPEQEYFIGRAVGATILKTYKPYESKISNHYLNVIGQTLAMASDKPETFKGYHFLILETGEINAFAAPGGFIFISRGLLRCCKNEDMLASVLAHEVGHIQHMHGLQAIKKSRWTSAVTTALGEAGKNLGGEQLAGLTTAFEGAIGDITATMVNSGYARKFETQADKSAVKIMERVGYNPRALKDMLLEMDRIMDHNSGGFAKTHPDPKVRIKDIEPFIDEYKPVSSPKKRQARFNKFISSI